MIRWVRAQTGRLHLDLGERSSQSLRVRAEHVIVTACRAHVAGDAVVEATLTGHVACSNCLQIYRQLIDRALSQGDRSA